MNFPKPYRIQALILQYIKLQFRDIGRIMDITFWPMIDVLIFGFTGFFVMQSAESYLPMSWLPLIGILLWSIVLKCHIEIALNLFDEIMSKNLANLFSSPLRFSEWLIATMIMGAIKGIIVLVLWGVLSYIIYGCNVLLLGWYLLPLVGLLFLAGWSLGCCGTALVLWYGHRIQSVIWGVGWGLVPFCGVLYPVSVLPAWAQTISAGMPMMYIFKGVTLFITTGAIPPSVLMVSFLIQIAFLFCALLFLAYMLKKSKNRGLARLEVD